MRCWESPGDLPLVIDSVSFRSFRCAALHSQKDIKFLSLVEDHPIFRKNLLFLHIPGSKNHTQNVVDDFDTQTT